MLKMFTQLFSVFTSLFTGFNSFAVAFANVASVTEVVSEQYAVEQKFSLDEKKKVFANKAAASAARYELQAEQLKTQTRAIRSADGVDAKGKRVSKPKAKPKATTTT